MDHHIKFALFFNLGVVNLDFVGLRKSYRGRGEQSESNPSHHKVKISLKEFHVAQIPPAG